MKTTTWRDAGAAVLVAFLGASTGCGSESAGGDAPSRTVRLELDTFDAQPGEEGQLCQTFGDPFGGAAEIAAWTSELRTGGHHMLVFVQPGAVDTPLGKCKPNDALGAPVFQGQQTGRGTLVYPDGTSALIPEGHGLIVQIHYANPNPETVTVRNTIEARLAAPGRAAAHVDPMLLENFDISVPPGGKPTTVSKTCPIEDDIDLVWITSHTHTHSTRVTASAGDVPIYDTTSPSEPVSTVLDPPVHVSAGQSITFSCTYVNGGAQEIGFGLSLEKNEMCNLVGGEIRGSGGGTPLRCKTSDETCLSCAEGLKQQKAELLCTDDGPPSSRSAYDALETCTCAAAPDGCATECSASSCSGGAPDDACFGCLSTRCGAQFSACFAASG